MQLLTQLQINPGQIDSTVLCGRECGTLSARALPLCLCDVAGLTKDVPHSSWHVRTLTVGVAGMSQCGDKT